MSDKLNPDDQIKILDKVEDIKKSFASASVDEEVVKSSFSEKLNSLIQSIFGDDTDSVYELLDKGDLVKYRKWAWARKIKRFITGNIRNAMYFAFLASIVGFLVSEAVTFYAVDGIVTTKVYVKAILTELSFIFLSGYVADTKRMKLAARALTASVFCLMLFVISAETLKHGTAGNEESKIIATQIITLEQQIKEKEELIKYYVSIKWPRNATTTRIEKEELVKKLLGLKDEQASGKNEEVTMIEKYKSYGKAFFRVILLFINMLIARRIFKF